MSEDASAEEMMAAKEAAMNSAECTRSRVSALESGASWYGSIRVGISSTDTAGVMDGYSRWGIKGSSEVSEGLTAVYRFENRINSANANAKHVSGRLSYVGLSGGFGTLTIGQVWSASTNSVGAIFDNSAFLGSSETSGRVGNAVSYAVSVENISIQVDAIMNNGGGKSAISKTGSAEEVKDDKNVDQMELGVSMGLGENAKIAFAHVSHDTRAKMKTESNLIGGQYTLGGMTAYLGFGQKKLTDDAPVNPSTANDVPAPTNRTDKTTFAGIHGSVGDTGVSYLFQARSKKAEGTELAYSGEVAPRPIAPNKHTTWMLGLSRSLGGGASVHFEHNSPDLKGKKSESYLALKVDF